MDFRRAARDDARVAAEAETIDAAREIAESAALQAADAERERRLPTRLVDELTTAGLFRMCVPERIGGLESSPQALVEVVETLARADAATAWCVAIGATSGLLSGYLDDGTAGEVYGPPASIAGGVFAPRGVAKQAGAGYRVSGRWPFASGCEHCDWLMGGCFVEQDGGLATLQNGAPDVRLMLAPAAEVEILDTWYVAGLRGTGSHDIEFVDVAVPAARSVSVFSQQPTAPGPLYAFPLFGLLAIAIAAVGLGAGRGALDDVTALAAHKAPAGGRRTLAERATAQVELATAEAELRAARALLFEAVEQAWAVATAEGEVPVAYRAALRLAATHAAQAGAAATASAFRLAGATAVYETSALQRRFRDAHVATQHMLVAPATWELAGRLLMGVPTDVTQL